MVNLCCICSKELVGYPDLTIACHLCGKKWHNNCGQGCNCLEDGLKKAGGITLKEFLDMYVNFTKEDKQGIRSHFFAFLCEDIDDKEDSIEELLEMVFYGMKG